MQIGIVKCRFCKKIESVFDNGYACEIHDVVAICRVAFRKHESLFVYLSARKLDDFFKTAQTSARGHNVVNDCNLFAFEQVGVVL